MYRAIVCLMFLFAVSFASRLVRAQGTCVGGEMLYLDTSSNVLQEVRGAEIHLLAEGLEEAPNDHHPRLDIDHTGSYGSDDGLFVLASSEMHDVVTLLYYPWREGNDKRPVRFLTQIVETRFRPDDKKKWNRGRARVQLTPTDSTISTSEQLARALKAAWVGSELAVQLDVNEKERIRFRQAELKLIVTMVPLESQKEILEGAKEILRNERILIEIWKQFEADIDSAFRLDAKALEETRQEQLELWKSMRRNMP